MTLGMRVQMLSRDPEYIRAACLRLQQGIGSAEDDAVIRSIIAPATLSDVGIGNGRASIREVASRLHHESMAAELAACGADDANPGLAGLDQGLYEE